MCSGVPPTDNAVDGDQLMLPSGPAVVLRGRSRPHERLRSPTAPVLPCLGDKAIIGIGPTGAAADDRIRPRGGAGGDTGDALAQDERQSSSVAPISHPLSSTIAKARSSLTSRSELVPSERHARPSRDARVWKPASEAPERRRSLLGRSARAALGASRDVVAFRRASTAGASTGAA